MPRLPEFWARALLLLLTGLAILLRYDDLVRTPNSRVVEPYGDGYKAYTVVIYHAKYDSTYTHFQGMNYPYGDHVVTGAEQPLLGNAFKFLKRQGLDLTGYVIGAINWGMLLGIFLCPLFLYLIFRRLDLPAWYAGTVALGMTFLAPETLRMIAHYGLCQPEVIPLTLFLFMNLETRPHLWISILIGLVVVVFALTHFYWVALLGFLISFYFLFSFLYRPSWRKLPRYALHYSLQILLPALGLFLWIRATDPIPERNLFPWGFFAFRARWEGVFTSMSQPHFRWLNDHLVAIRALDFEAWTYVGLAATVAFLVIMVTWAARRFRMPPLDLHDRYNPFLNKIFFTGLATLIFSLGVPFIIPGLEGLLAYTGPLKQFRSIGRFAWIFYHVMNIVAFVWIYRRLAPRAGRMRPYVLGLPLAVLWFEAYHFTTSFSTDMEEVPEFAPGESFTRLKIGYDRFQAVHPVPYYNIGSDNFWWEPEGFILQKSLTISIQTGLPVTSAMLTRTSLSHTLNLLQLATPPYRTPAIFRDFPDDRPLLMALDQQEFEKERKRYEHFLEGTELLYEEDRLQLYNLPLSSFEERIRQRQQQIASEIAADSLLYRHGGMLSSRPDQDFIRVSFDSLAAPGYLGRGFTGGGRDAHLLYDGPGPAMTADSQYVVSLWMYLNAPLRARSELELVELAPDGAWLQHRRIPARLLAHIFDNNGWALLEMPLHRRRADSRLRLSLQNNELRRDQPLYADELLIRAAGTDLYMQNDTMIWKNNLWFPGARASGPQ